MQLYIRVRDDTHVIEAESWWSAEDVLRRLPSEGGPFPLADVMLSHNGVPLRDRLDGVQLHDTLDVLPRLRGGGGDGGSTGAESRSCYLEMYLGKKPDKVNPEEERLARWTTCHLSGELLSPPVVADGLGSIFNKEALLQALLDHTLPPGLEHIRGLKSVTELKLELPSESDKAVARFVCPITGVAATGKAHFVYNTATGYVVSERAMRELPKVVEESAGDGSKDGRWVPLNPSEEELDKLRALLGPAPSKKSKKKKVRAVDGAGDDGAEPALSAPLPGAPALELGPPLQKKAKVESLAPANADKKIWNSLFAGKHDKDIGDGYMTRGTASRGMKMA